MKEIAIKKDKYSSRRGGPSTLFDLVCGGCESPLLVYQKDGKGRLMRCYADRIAEARNIKGVNPDDLRRDLSMAKALRCNGCENLVGVAMTYEKENRPAFRLIKGTFTRRPH